MSLGVAGALVAGLLGAAQGTAGHAAADAGSAAVGAAGPGKAPAVPVLSWKPCGQSAPEFECATAKVPLDHDQPHGPAISLALTRIRATDPSRRIGSLFLNPGGPGSSGVDFAQSVGKTLYSAEVRARFDLVGFDPRGVAASTPLTCFDTAEQAAAATAPFAFPVTVAEEREWVKYDRAYAAACARRAGPVIDHMSTANVARDLDLLRAAVGDQKLTYAGYSYGTYIGSVYANLFPHRVRAVLIDGVIDPVSDATGRNGEWRRQPVDARLKSEQGAYQTLREFLRLCDAGGATCAFSGGNPTARYDALAARLRKQPITMPDGEGGSVVVTYADLVTTSLVAMYSPVDWPEFAKYLQGLDIASAGAVRAARAALADPPYTQGAEGFYGVWCTDSLNPSSASAWARAARAADRQWPYFGRRWIWGSSICANWPGRDADRYLGPFSKPTAHPVLVVGNRWDPATRYEDAVSTSRILGRARLLTVSGWGHTSLFTSACADGYASAYLLTGALPAAGTVCRPDAVPFAATTRVKKPAPPYQWRPPHR
ncbi:TAP domain protein [Kribbella flavida DSM 17836]|uniref:TAP domain protein n=1 Tax=Kribbella flavida (strain DSM 17836 / JCM 10339 / NBRC 14399) TaxID=479435 RepID=D2Q1Q1_KRIFD|nr:alpha/beta hydrolase [Kribbella flavida]ADB32040.1 TAP domain protein [Kribbella flavida DSM 17836]